MRNLTIKRHKSFVGCAVKDKVYIQDFAASELMIDGVPCRKLGEVKNGQEATFQIDDTEQKVFLIADTVSKEYCNASVTVPAGSEDVSYAGKHHFVLGSNPFRFDGQEVSADQKKKGRKGIIILIAALIGGLIVGNLIGNLLFNNEPDPKTFTEGDVTITLTDEFEVAQYEDFHACFESRTAAVFVLKEEAEYFDEDTTLEEYVELSLEVNETPELEIQKTGDRYYVEYVEEVEGEEYFYMVFFYMNEDAFYVVNFSTPEANRDLYKDDFALWAASVFL